MDAPARIWKPILDVNDLAIQSEFWSWLLGVEVILEVGEVGIHLGPPGGPAVLAFQRVPEPKAVKDRMHLDLVSDDVDAVVEEVQQRGGSLVEGPTEYFAGRIRWYVMADPEGNEFCLSSPIPGT